MHCCFWPAPKSHPSPHPVHLLPLLRTGAAGGPCLIGLRRAHHRPKSWPGRTLLCRCRFLRAAHCPALFSLAKLLHAPTSVCKVPWAGPHAGGGFYLTPPADASIYAVVFVLRQPKQNQRFAAALSQSCTILCVHACPSRGLTHASDLGSMNSDLDLDLDELRCPGSKSWVRRAPGRVAAGCSLMRGRLRTAQQRSVGKRWGGAALALGVSRGGGRRATPSRQSRLVQTRSYIHLGLWPPGPPSGAPCWKDCFLEHGGLGLDKGPGLGCRAGMVLLGTAKRAEPSAGRAF